MEKLNIDDECKTLILDKDFISELKLKAKLSRLNVLKMAHAAQASHIGSSLSILDILVSAYGAKGLHTSSIKHILVSKGHAAAAVYAVLAEFGYISKSKLDTYCQNGSDLSGHVSHNNIAEIPLSTGSLGHALPVGAGIALDKILRNLNEKVVVILSDGECDEGSNWEALMFSSHLKLNNLIIVIDRNNLQSLTTTEQTMALEPLDQKLKAFGCMVTEVDGHSIEELLSTILKPTNSPHVIIANTIKGFGIKIMENDNVWHYRPPSDEILKSGTSEILERF